MEPNMKNNQKDKNSIAGSTPIIDYNGGRNIKEVISITEFEPPSDTEITAEISVPADGGWGWVVVAASFTCIFILDGVFFTFASMFKGISEDIEADESLVALVNSIAIALYFITGPVVSALINKFGFRSCTMTGSIIVSLSYFLSYFAENYMILLLTYGIMPGFGGCFIYMSSQLIVGFYFERLRAVAMSISGLGQSIGVMALSHLNTYLVQLSGWRTTTLLHSGLFGLIYFISMAYRPLISITVTQTTDDVRTVTYLPSLSTISSKASATKKGGGSLSSSPSIAERLFKAPSNINFPTAAAVLEESEISDESKPGPSSGPIYTVTARSPLGSIHKGQIWSNQRDKQIEVAMTPVDEPVEKKKWWSSVCRWHKHVNESRPMYRDDAFYNTTLQKLPIYQKVIKETPQQNTGFKYKMAVSRTVTASDLKEQKFFSTAVRRILATMMNPKLLRRRSFLLVCSTGFFTHVGILVPYVFLPDRNKTEGIDPKHCNFFVSIIGFANAIGKIIAGLLAYKFHRPVKIYYIACLTAGLAVIISIFSFNVYYQYFCCVIFGVSVAHISALRSLVVVDLYGLDNLTNATGILLMFQGFGTLISTPLSSVLRRYFGYMVSFCVAGAFIVTGGLILMRVTTMASKEVEVKIKRYIIARRRSTLKSNVVK